MHKILVTGFEPFDGQTVNPSQLLVETLDQDHDLKSRIQTALLPVSYNRAAKTMEGLLEKEPSIAAVLMFGLAKQRTSLSLERTAINWVESQIADEDGVYLGPGVWRPGRPSAYVNKLPLADWACELSGQGLLTEVSLSAGGYVCNATAFAVADWLSARGDARPWIFVHVPPLAEGTGSKAVQTLEGLQKCAFSLMEMIKRGPSSSVSSV